MKKLLFSLAAALGSGLFASACNPATPYAALVNGRAIPQSQLNSELAAIAGNPSDVAAIEAASQGQGGTPLAINGSAPGTYNIRFAAEALDQDIEFAVIDQTFHRRHLALTPYELEAARSDLPSQLAGQGQAPVRLADFPRSYQNTLVRRQAEILGLEASLAHVDLSQAGVETYESSHGYDMMEACASRIEVATLQAAGAVLSDLAAGKSFATEAQSKSTDTNTASAGGQLGCGTGFQFEQSFGPAFAKAVASTALGQPAGPVLSSGGFDIIEVTQRQPLPPSAAGAQVRQALLSGAGSDLDNLLTVALRAARISVDSRYGTWSTAGSGGISGVVPPALPIVRDDGSGTASLPGANG